MVAGARYEPLQIEMKPMERFLAGLPRVAWGWANLLDLLELIHATITQIPDPGQRLVRYYAWYANRLRGARAPRLVHHPKPPPPRGAVMS
jgi:hypothetical protein